MIVEIVVAAFGEPDELLRFMREREQTLAKDNRDRRVAGTVHEQERSFHPGDALVGVKRIPHDEAHREDRKTDAATSAIDV